MKDRIAIEPSGPITGAIRPPGSKSLTNRALVCAALAEGESVLRGALVSEDTRVMIDSLRMLGIDVEEQAEGEQLRVGGCGGKLPASSADLFVANSGTTIRFLTALASLGHGTYRFDGVQRMRERPIADLLVALRQLGADVRSAHDNGCPPVVVRANGLTGGAARVKGSISSQFLSGLLMAAPYAAGDVTISVEGELVSRPYVAMTLAVMRSFGVEVVEDDSRHFTISAPRKYIAADYAIEPDASAASYFWAAAAITGGSVRVEGLALDALQGDVAFCDALARMGCDVRYDDDSITVLGRSLRGIAIDMNAISDTVQTLAAVALFADGPTTITGVAHNRHKETDRIGDLARELRKFGADVTELDDGLQVVPPENPCGATVDTYNDHRMAMSLSLVGLGVPNVTINNPQCTQKTYPHYFDDLQRLGAAGS